MQSCYPNLFDTGDYTCGANGKAALGTPCKTFNDCAPGLVCYVSTGATAGLCAKICDPSSIDSCGGGLCQSLDGTIGACVCDPSDATTCASGHSCYPDVLFATAQTFCAKTGTALAGGACNASNDCVANATCVPDSTGKGYCRTLCAGPGVTPNTCAADETCRNLDDNDRGLGGGCWCDVMRQTGCGAGKACYYYDGCRPPGTTATGSPCAKDSQCVPGDMCYADYVGNKTCHRLCSATKACPGSMTCQDTGADWCPRQPEPPAYDGDDLSACIDGP
jgi:hypothetical protein